MNHQSNGNGKPKNIEEIKSEPIKFPVTYDLKAVLVSTENDNESKAQISRLLEQHKVKFSYLNKKLSSKGAYISFTFNVTMENQQQMQELYKDLKTLEGLRFAI